MGFELTITSTGLISFWFNNSVEFSVTSEYCDNLFYLQVKKNGVLYARNIGHSVDIISSLMGWKIGLQSEDINDFLPYFANSKSSEFDFINGESQITLIFKFKKQKIEIPCFIISMDRNKIKHLATDLKNLHLDEKNSETKKGIGQLYYEKAIQFLGDKENFQKAVELLEKALEKQYLEENCFINLFVCYNLKEDYQKSLQIINRCLDLYPNSVVAIEKLSNLYLSLEKYEDAIKLFDKLLNINFKEEYIFNKAQALLNMKEYNKCLELIQNLDSRADYMKGLCFYNLNDYRKSIYYYERYCKKHTDVNVLLKIANMYEIYDTEKALEYYLKVKQINKHPEQNLDKKILQLENK